jgi:hypothetical protein
VQTIIISGSAVQAQRTTCSEQCKLLASALLTTYARCMERRCPNGRELEFTPEVALAKTAAESFESKKSFTENDIYFIESMNLY